MRKSVIYIVYYCGDNMACFVPKRAVLVFIFVVTVEGA